MRIHRVLPLVLPLVLLLVLLASGCAGTPAPGPDPIYEVDGVVVALLDTGVSADAIAAERLLPGWNYVDDSADTQDEINHGTAVASAIVGCERAGVAGIAPDAYLVPLVVVAKGADGDQRRADPETLARAIRDSVDRYGADVINLSLGIKKDVPAVRRAVDYAQQHGVLVVSAVGNQGGEEEVYYPAAYDTVLAVGSHDRWLQISGFSQGKAAADILAPGEDIWLASRKGKTYGARGTSYATGFVSGAAARLLAAEPSLTPDQVRARLTDTPHSAQGCPILVL